MEHRVMMRVWGIVGLSLAAPVLAVQAPEDTAPASDPPAVETADAPVPIFAQERPRPRSMRPGMGGLAGMFGMQDDPELAQLALDIHLLRAINQMQLTRAQVDHILPALRHAIEARHHAREVTKRRLHELREQLLRGTEPDGQAGEAFAQLQRVQREAARAGEEARRVLRETLEPHQQRILQQVLTAGMPGQMGPGFGQRQAGPFPPPSGPRAPGGARPERVAPRPGMSPLILERFTVLLSEKRRYLPR